MFRILVYTDDKKLPKLMRAFKGLILGRPEIDLIEGAEEVEGELHEAGEVPQTHPNERRQGHSGGRHAKPVGATLPDRVMALLLKQKPPVITAKELREATVEAGSTENSYNYVVVALRKWKAMTGPTAAGIYTLNEAAYQRRLSAGES